jgi:hypothetical protein
MSCMTPWQPGESFPWSASQVFEIERELRGNPTRGVVMLVAEDEDSIRATHSHYFKSFDELVDLAEA